MNTPGDVVVAASAMGLPRLLLGLTAAMPPPLGVGQTSKAGGPTAAPKLNPQAAAPPALREGHPPYPSARPWEAGGAHGPFTLYITTSTQCSVFYAFGRFS